MNSWIKAAAVAAAVLATPIVAQETLGSSAGAQRGGGGMGMLRMADANGDGVVTRDEWIAASDARFARMDANGDGVLDANERPRWQESASGDKITRDQFRAQSLRRFDRLDSNHDGKVDATEMAAAATLMRARRASGGDVPPPPPGE